MSERVGRALGYVAATVVGVGVGAFFAATAVAQSICATWGEECTPEETAEIARSWKMALVAPAVAIGVYGLFDVVVLGLYRRSHDEDHAPPGLSQPVGIMSCSRHGAVDGTAVVWHDEQGWGVVSSPDVNGEVWTHFSNVAGTGHRSLSPGQAVTFSYETPGQDGYPHRALWVSPR